MSPNSKLQSFPQAMVVACGAALDAGIFYNDQFEEFVFKHMGGFGCEAVLMEVADLDGTAPGFWETQRELTRRLEAAVVAAPRGHYAVIRKNSESCGVIYKTIVSDGHGDSPAVGGNYDSYATMPPAEKVLARFVGYEVYLCRKVLERERAAESARAAAAKYGLHEGMRIKDVVIGGVTHSSGVVTRVDCDKGEVTLELTRRGSSRRWIVTLPADALAQRASLSDATVKRPAEPADTHTLPLF